MSELVCPRAGFVVLSTKNQHLVKRTICKTWRCRACSKKVAALTAMKMAYGCVTTSQPWYFITTTYRYRDVGDIIYAPTARKDWAELWRRLKLDRRYASAAWIKVPELTKNLQVHLHAIVVNVRGPASCRISKYGRKRWMQSTCGKRTDSDGDCAEHSIARHWFDITGASFVVDCQDVRSPNGIAYYLQKYFAKTFEDRTALEALGYSRRWSSSKNWPRVERLHLAGTDTGWHKTTRIAASRGRWNRERASRGVVVELNRLAKLSERSPLMQQAGGDYALATYHKAKRTETAKKLEEIMVAYDDYSDTT